jgi:DNA-binding NtrC family response regulator
MLDDTTCDAPSVLAIDDDPDMLALLERMWGDDVRVIVADSAAAAAQKLESMAFDAVWMDVYLPDGDGTVLLEELRAGDFGERNRAIPAVMMTASRESEHYESAWELASLAYLRKPVTIDDLREAMDRCLAENDARASTPARVAS